MFPTNTKKIVPAQKWICSLAVVSVILKNAVSTLTDANPAGAFLSQAVRQFSGAHRKAALKFLLSSL